MEVLMYEEPDLTTSPPLHSPGSAGAYSPQYAAQYASVAQYSPGGAVGGDLANAGGGRVRVLRPTPVRLRAPVDERRLPCCGYPGPIKVPLCGDLQCRHLPCYTWHQQQAALPAYWARYWAPLQRGDAAWHPVREDVDAVDARDAAVVSVSPAAASADGVDAEYSEHLVQVEQRLLLKELLMEPHRPVQPASMPVQATVTTPGGTVTLYSWPDGDAPRAEDDDDDVVVVETLPPPQPPQLQPQQQPPQQQKRRGRKPASAGGQQPKPARKPRTPRKPRKAKKDALKDAAEEVLAEGVAVHKLDADTRGHLLRVLGLLCERRGLADDEDAKSDEALDLDDALPFLQPDVPTKVRRVLRGVAKALM